MTTSEATAPSFFATPKAAMEMESKAAWQDRSFMSAVFVSGPSGWEVGDESER